MDPISKFWSNIAERIDGKEKAVLLLGGIGLIYTFFAAGPGKTSAFVVGCISLMFLGLNFIHDQYIGRNDREPTFILSLFNLVWFVGLIGFIFAFIILKT